MKKTIEVRKYKSSVGAVKGLRSGTRASVFGGDCFELLSELPTASVDLVITSPPYCIGMEYERAKTVEDFLDAHRRVLPEIIRVTKPGGSICWQVGYHVSRRVAYPLDYAIFSILEG